MQLVKLVVQLNLAEPMRPWLDLRAVIRAAVGDEGSEIQAPPFNFDSAKLKRRVILQLRTITVHDERDSDLPRAVHRMVDVFESIHRASPFEAVLSMTTEASFIEPLDLPFHEAVASVKSGMLARSALVDSSSDVGVSLDFDEGDVFRHVQVGPMELSQLKGEILRWPDSDLAPVFVYLNLRQRQQLAEFDAKKAAEMLNSAGEWQVRQAEAVLQTLQLR